jgi:hypothetical protein
MTTPGPGTTPDDSAPVQAPGDEESRQEVEVTLAGGLQVDVRLDDRFAVVGTEADEHPDDSGPGDG